MFKSGRIALSVVGGLMLGAVVVCLLSERQALSYPPESKPAKWQYTTATVEIGALQVKLDELGNGEWEVFAVDHSDSFVEQGGDGKTRLIVEKFQVTARKLVK